MTVWICAEDSLPPAGDFYWVKVEGGNVHLAFYDGNHFRTAETAGDREGLNVEYFFDVTHYREVQEPVDHGLTACERQVCKLISALWNFYLQMPDAKDTDDLRVIRDAVHAIQGVMAVRVARRVDPDFWR